MKELSIFIDESGDFGAYNYHSPWYIVTMVFHDQRKSIQEPLEHLEKELLLLGLENHCITYGQKLQSAYEKTDDPAKKSAIAKEWKENGARLRDLK